MVQYYKCRILAAFCVLLQGAAQIGVSSQVGEILKVKLDVIDGQRCDSILLLRLTMP
jgi:hypothetical protein